MAASLPATAPALRSARLTLTGITAADVEASAGLWGDPAVVRYIGGRALTGEEVWTRLLRYVGHWALLGYGYWVVRETATGRFVGEVGFADYRREIVPALDAPEAGWVLAPWAHGQGFAAEVLTLMLAWADVSLAAPRTVCIIDPGNIPSLRLAHRFGYAVQGECRYRGAAITRLERPRFGLPTG